MIRGGTTGGRSGVTRKTSRTRKATSVWKVKTKLPQLLRWDQSNMAAQLGGGGEETCSSVLVGPLGPALLTSLLRGPFQVLQSLNLSSRSLFILGSPADVNLMLSVQKTPRMSLTNEWRLICSLKGPDNLR